MQNTVTLGIKCGGWRDRQFLVDGEIDSFLLMERSTVSC